MAYKLQSAESLSCGSMEGEKTAFPRNAAATVRRKLKKEKKTCHTGTGCIMEWADVLRILNILHGKEAWHH